MLNLLDETLEEFLRAELPLSRRQVDVSFDAPDSDWAARVTKPTLNLFLWDMRLNLKLRHAGVEVVEEEPGKPQRRRPRPRVDCRYLVTAWTAEVRDEHQLLGSVLSMLLAHGEIPAEYLQGAYSAVRPLPLLSVAEADGRDQSDFWSAIGGKLKPGLDLVVTATVDLALAREVGPPVERYEITVGDRDTPARRSATRAVGGAVDDPTAAGAAVSTRRGKATVDRKGRFLVRAEPGDEVVVETDPPVSKKAPASGTLNVSARGRGQRRKGEE